MRARGFRVRGDAAEPQELVIGGEMAGQRLDRAVGLLAPGGLRGRRRRIAQAGVRVNGHICRDCARRLKAGDVLALEKEKAPDGEVPDANAPARLLGRSGGYCFLFKGAGLHTAALAGKSGDSLEARCQSLCAPVLRPGESPLLLQRLDFGTSGIVCAALTEAAAQDFHAAEAAGECEKRYLALLTGALAAPVTAQQPLDTARRSTTRVLAGEAGPLRHTEFLPLQVFDGEAATRLCALAGMGPPATTLTLTACRIRLGARHQIRAHAAALGHPLAGDTRYGAPGEAAAGPGLFFLHHGLLAWPGGRCSARPPWPWLSLCLAPETTRRVRAWLELSD